MNEAHPCGYPGCGASVPYDDEPYCFHHSPDSGSSVPGYSYKRSHPDHNADRSTMTTPENPFIKNTGSSSIPNQPQQEPTLGQVAPDVEALINGTKSFYRKNAPIIFAVGATYVLFKLEKRMIRKIVSKDNAITREHLWHLTKAVEELGDIALNKKLAQGTALRELFDASAPK